MKHGDASTQMQARRWSVEIQACRCKHGDASMEMKHGEQLFGGWKYTNSPKRPAVNWTKRQTMLWDNTPKQKEEDSTEHEQISHRNNIWVLWDVRSPEDLEMRAVTQHGLEAPSLESCIRIPDLLLRGLTATWLPCALAYILFSSSSIVLYTISYILYSVI